jgi:cysteine synthase
MINEHTEHREAKDFQMMLPPTEYIPVMLLSFILGAFLSYVLLRPVKNTPSPPPPSPDTEFLLPRQANVPRWQPPQIVNGLSGCVGNTPLIYLRTLSEATGCTILGKAEFLNPGGSSKDRIAREIVLGARKSGALPKGGTIVEGTSGSTGISLSLMAAATGCKCDITMPSDQAVEKSNLMSLFGANVQRVSPAAISNDGHYSRLAESRAMSDPDCFYTDQFENLDNVRAHRSTTGPEIWQQTGGRIDAFVMSAGTGGSLTGVGSYLKEKKREERQRSSSSNGNNSGSNDVGNDDDSDSNRDSDSDNGHSNDVRVILADPEGSVLYHRVKDGVAYAPQQAERTLRRVRVDTITEGIGIDRLTKNFTEYEECIDDAMRVSDQEAVNMAWHLMRKEGLFVGSSSGLNCTAAVRVAREMGPGNVIVTVLCDSGSRHLTKLYDVNFLDDNGLEVNPEDALGLHL